MIGEHNTLYHSALVAFCKQHGPAIVTLTMDAPQASQYKGKPPFMGIIHDGAKQTYNVENDACGEALSGYKGQTVCVYAEGREKDAIIEVTAAPDDAGSPPPRQPARAPQQQRAAAPPQRQQPTAAPARNQAPARLTPEEKAAKEEVAFKKMKQTGARVAVAMRASMLHMQKLFVEMGLAFYAEDGNFTLSGAIASDDFRAFCITHFIEVKSTTDINALPLQWLDLTQKQAPAAQPAPQRTPPQRTPPPQQEPPVPAEPPYDENGEAEDDIPF